MTWISLALLSAAIFGAVAVADKRLIDRHMPSLSSYYVWVGLAVLFNGLLFLAIAGFPTGAPDSRLIIAGVSGLCWGGALALTFWSFKHQEVSRASAVIYIFPVFVALLSVVFLGESMELGQWLAMLVAVAGASLISCAGSSGRFSLTRVFPVLILASLLTAVGHVTGKYALEDLSVWTVTSFRFFGMAVPLAFFWRRQAVRQLGQAMRSKQTVALLVFSELILVPAAVLLLIVATKMGPVSLVATLTGSRPLFVLLFSSILSLSGLKILQESMDRRSLAVKLVSFGLIVVGIAAL